MRIRHPSKDLHKNMSATRDLGHIIVGNGLGAGQNRSVWALEFCPDLVIKYENSGDDFQNVMEWRVWNCVKDTPLSKWFAPCVALSPNGIWLVQKKITFPAADKYPKTMPDFFPDTQYVNYGLFEGRWVACDYGTPSFAWLLSRHIRLSKVKWLGSPKQNG